MSRPGFKCRTAFVAQGGNPVHFFTNLSVNVSSFSKVMNVMSKVRLTSNECYVKG